MSDSDLESNDESGRGKSAGSRRTQFSSDKQPTKRRQATPRKDVKASLVALLRQPVTIVVGGKARKVEFLQAFLSSIPKDLMNAKFEQKLQFIQVLERSKLSGVMAEQARLDEQRAELETERREFTKQQQFARQLSELSRGNEDRLKAELYAMAAVLAEVRDVVEWGDDAEILKVKIENICKSYKPDPERDALFARLLQEFGSMGEPDDGDYDEWQDDDVDDDPDDDRREGDDSRDCRDDTDSHDPTTEGAIEYDPAEYDESSILDTHDPNDPELDLANGQIGAEDLAPPASSNDGED